MKNVMLISKIVASVACNALLLNLFGVDAAITWGVMMTIAQVIVAITMPTGILGHFLNPSHFTFNGKEIQSISEIIFDRAFKLPELREFHRVQTGIKAKQQIGYHGYSGLVGIKYIQCAPSHPDIKPNGREKYWDPAPIFTRTIECWEQMRESFLVWAYNNGINKPDITTTEIAQYMIERLTIEQMEGLFRIVYFGDIAADNQSNGSYLINSVQPDFFTPINGIWVQAFNIVSGDPTKYVNIARNTGATYALQEFDATDTTNKTAHQIFQKMLKQADYRLKDQPDKIFIVTYSLYEQYLNELETYVNTEGAFRLVQEGKSTLMYRGVPIYPFNQWDRIMRTYYDNGTRWLNFAPHRAILTTRTNLAIGLEDETSFRTFDMHYDKISHYVYTDALYMLDAKVISDELCIFAY